MIIKNEDAVIQFPDNNTKRKILANGNNLLGARVIFDKTTSSVVPHTHPHDQFTYVLKGKLKFIIDGKETIVTAGDSLLFPSNVPHGCIVLEEGSEVLDVFTPTRQDFLK
ncbi:MAG: cupin [Clostridiaceae bacterium]|jgi:quercetin dioxygenase-like cupin family protein|nr:cupin [Clostridiaceae bacterium]